MSHEKVPPDNVDLPDDMPLGDGVELVWKEDGEWYGSDDHGEFKLTTGSPHPVDPSDLKYDPCNCVLKYTFKRYGMRRYCTGMSGSNFNLEFDTCKHHRSRKGKKFMEAQAELFKHGAHARSYESKYRYLESHQKIIVNEIYKSLLNQSRYNFDEETVELRIDVSDEDFGGENDTLVMKHPVPNQNESQCKALWFAALDFITMESMREERMREAFESDNVDAIGERWTVVASGDGGPVYDKDEHHLNLPLSRLQKDYKRDLEYGGVLQEDDESTNFEEREYILEVVSEEKPTAPEAQHGETSPLHSIDTPDEPDA